MLPLCMISQLSTSSPLLLDSKTSHHVTNDLHNPYDGTKELILGDCKGLYISHTSLLNFSQYFLTIFQKFLYVPSISRNIIFIYQFCHENNASIEFLPDSFVLRTSKQGKFFFGFQLNPTSMNFIHFRLLPP